MKKVLAVSITVAVLIIVVFILNRELPQVAATVPGTCRRRRHRQGRGGYRHRRKRYRFQGS